MGIRPDRSLGPEDDHLRSECGEAPFATVPFYIFVANDFSFYTVKNNECKFLRQVIGSLGCQ